MAGLRIFISSTCFDLKAYRSQLQTLLLSMGHEPILSENGDILYDPAQHTHTSCVTEIPNADVLVLLIGARYGGAAKSEALEKIDFAKFDEVDAVNKQALSKLSLSVTQAEVLKAIEIGIPIFVFVDQGVHADLFVYTTNKRVGIHKQIQYPNIDKQETAEFIFEFIEFLRRQASNNAIFPFSSFGEIESNLTRQLSMLFQKLLRDERDRKSERERNRLLLTEIRDVKAAILQSIDQKSARDVARAVLKYRRLVEFLSELRLYNSTISLENEKGEFFDLLGKFGVLDIRVDSVRPHRVPNVAFIMSGSFFLQVRASPTLLDRFALDWNEFCKLPTDLKEAVIESASEIENRFAMIRRIEMSYDDYLTERYDAPIASYSLKGQETLGDILGRALQEEASGDDGDDVDD